MSSMNSSYELAIGIKSTSNYDNNSSPSENPGVKPGVIYSISFFALAFNVSNDISVSALEKDDCEWTLDY